MNPDQGARTTASVEEAQTFTVPAETLEVAQIHEQIKRLTAKNNRLRLQLAATDRQQPEQGPHVTDLANARTAHSPEVSRRELGIRLGKLRNDKGLTVQQVAEHLMCKAAKVRRMEAGVRAGTLRDVRDKRSAFASDLEVQSVVLGLVIPWPCRSSSTIGMVSARVGLGI